VPLDQSPLPGILAGRYAIEREIGRGAMATVYLARDLRHERPVAVKVLGPELARRLGSERFLREIRIAATLQHPNVLPLYDSGEAEGFLYYVMPYIAGSTLRARLLAERRLPVAEALAIARETADALAHAHDAGIVHRDIKPENILLESGHAVVADFGIARALGAASAGATDGLPLGTPGYMSPEQLTGQESIDGRSDIYGLGCVLYEMLSGELPDASSRAETTGRRTPKRLTTFRLTRPDAPRWLEEVIARTLAVSPAERYPDARSFAAALSGWVPLRARPRRTWALLAAVVALTLVAVGWWRISHPRLDRELYAVLPFRQRPGAGGPKAINGDLSESLLYEAMSRWSGVRLVNSMRVRDAVLRRGGSVTELSRSLEIARAAGAGLLVWGEIWERSDTTFVRAVLYDVTRNGSAIRERVLTVPPGPGDVGREFVRLANQLVLGSVATRLGDEGLGTRSISAVREYAIADSAIGEWNLEAAKGHLRAALASDPAFARANLRLAMISEWSGEPSSRWQAALAALPSSGLAPADQQLARALAALAAGDYGRACAAYHARLSRDTTDFVAWLGLGQCQARDRLVIPDSLSPSRWRFRSSYHAAILAYRRALELLPSAYLLFQENSFGRLKQLMFTEVDAIREGYYVGRDTLWFAAFPSWQGDTLAFVPFPRKEFLEGRREAMPPSWPAAVARNREQLRDLSAVWIRAFPDSAAPRMLMAEQLELGGDLNLSRPASDSALLLLHEAARLTRDGIRGVEIGVAEVRLFLKLGQFSEARRTGDSLLLAWREPPAEIALRLAPVAELLGRPTLASDLLARWSEPLVLRTAEGNPIKVPTGVWQPAFALLAQAAAGAGEDSLDAMERRVERRITALVLMAQQPATREAVFDDAASFAFVVAGLRRAQRPTSGARQILEFQWHIAHGELAMVRRRLAGLDQLRESAPPGATAMHTVFLEAALQARMGDSAAAAHRLDIALNALPASRLDLLEEIHKAAALVRAMALRAELATASGKRDVALKWALAVKELWAEGEPTVNGILASMDAVIRRANKY
jgi:tRNA A-37 threonylcarbamoyl transferase component Bud32/tetratricopeptide (TPR) repeat protein